MMTETFTRQVVRPVTQSEARAELQAEGFRLPTSDEWEYVCAVLRSDAFPVGRPLPRRFSSAAAEVPARAESIRCHQEPRTEAILGPDGFRG